jgi:hypothetical protein
VAKYLPKPLRTVYRGGRAGAVNRFTSRNAAVIKIEGQSHERSDLCHRLQLLSAPKNLALQFDSGWRHYNMELDGSTVGCKPRSV